MAEKRGPELDPPTEKNQATEKGPHFQESDWEKTSDNDMTGR